MIKHHTSTRNGSHFPNRRIRSFRVLSESTEENGPITRAIQQVMSTGKAVVKEQWNPTPDQVILGRQIKNTPAIGSRGSWSVEAFWTMSPLEWPARWVLLSITYHYIVDHPSYLLETRNSCMVPFWNRTIGSLRPMKILSGCNVQVD